MPSNPDLDSPTCRRCPYHPEKIETSAGQRVLAPVGGRRHTPLHAEVNGSETLLLLQAPGVNEWNEGRPLASSEHGSAGQRFQDALQFAEKCREDYDIAEAVNCYPGKNAKGRDRKPPIGVIEVCSHWLVELIRERRYTTIVLFGRVAEQALVQAWFANPEIARSITRIVKLRYITLESVESIAEVLRDCPTRPEQTLLGRRYVLSLLALKTQTLRRRSGIRRGPGRTLSRVSLSA